MRREDSMYLRSWHVVGIQVLALPWPCQCHPAHEMGNRISEGRNMSWEIKPWMGYCVLSEREIAFCYVFELH